MSSDIAKVHDIEWFAEVPRSIRKPVWIGLGLLLLVFGGFGTWAFTAPLAAAIVAPGSFVATGQNKIVQHLEGGIIKSLLVSEGDHVVEGQPLVKLDETSALTNDRQLFLRRARLEAVVARLTAEAHGAETIAWPAIVDKNRGDADVAEIIESQDVNFQSSLGKLKSDVTLFQQNIDSLDFRIRGYELQSNSLTRQLGLLNEEYQGKTTLLKMGLLRGTEIKTIQRAIADAEGQVGRLDSEAAETKAQQTRYDQQIDQARRTYQQAALDELQTAETELDTIREQSRQAESVLKRTTIEAPVTGTVVRMFYHTSGGVIESGKQILEILPSDVPLILEVQVPRTDIDNVRVGEHATVRLTALNQRITPVLNGEVFYVSADAIPDTTHMDGREVYVARVKLPVSEIARVPGFSPTPGMPAEILIQTAKRTFFEYISKPVRDSMARAFSEN
ncbi:HlyD family type I secretion periplasmic adaptor subunit [Aureimonas sp. ME7]|uniref:HlyD family type I secretion periplasmic adaptor subunit n=1 Tax=Aureimonas sp. ME7 TaxID=2744252 RepID=UPI0015F675D9|nr:HlyD family type I secretion periplasmic adaptor subunit [Aureimonas sp. ME7]